MYSKHGHDFVYLLYKEQNVVTYMNQLRQELFSSKKNTPRIKSLPPTDTASAEHLKRDHLQTMNWKSFDLLTKPAVNITMFGWRIESGVPHPCTGVENSHLQNPRKLWLVSVALKVPAPETHAHVKQQD